MTTNLIIINLALIPVLISSCYVDLESEYSAQKSSQPNPSSSSTHNYNLNRPKLKKKLKNNTIKVKISTKSPKTKFLREKNLLQKQQNKFDEILSELKTHNKKLNHWIWWVFPTTKPGDSESAPKTNVTQKSANYVLTNTNLDKWSEILEKIFALLKANPIGTWSESENKPNKKIIPQIDHGRIYFSLIFWLQKVKAQTQKYPRFYDALENLTKFKWQ